MDGNDKKYDSSAASPTAIISAGELEVLKRIDPDEYPDIVEKDVLLKLYRIKVTDVAV